MSRGPAPLWARGTGGGPLPPFCPGPDHSVALSNGGHPPPLLVRAGGEVEEVAGEGGMLLGIYSDAELVDQRLDLRPGDPLVLFADGLAERRYPHEDPGGRLRELLQVSARAGALPRRPSTSL